MGSAEWIHWFYFAHQNQIFFCFLEAVYQTIQQPLYGQAVHEIGCAARSVGLLGPRCPSLLRCSRESDGGPVDAKIMYERNVVLSLSGLRRMNIHSRASLSMKERDFFKKSLGIRICRRVPIYSPNIVFLLSFPMLLFTFADSPLLK